MHIMFLCIGAIIYSYPKYGAGNGPVVYSNVDCFGSEKCLSECSKSVFPYTYCYGAGSVVGLKCLDCKQL